MKIFRFFSSVSVTLHQVGFLKISNWKANNPTNDNNGFNFSNPSWSLLSCKNSVSKNISSNTHTIVCNIHFKSHSMTSITAAAAAAAAKSLQSCSTLCNPRDGSPPGSPVPGILQARTLEWVAISFSNAWKGKVKVKSLSRVQLLVTPWTAAYQASPSMGFSRQEYWSGLPFLETIFLPLAIKTELLCCNRKWKCLRKNGLWRLSKLLV